MNNQDTPEPNLNEERRILLLHKQTLVDIVNFTRQSQTVYLLKVIGYWAFQTIFWLAALILIGTAIYTPIDLLSYSVQFQEIMINLKVREETFADMMIIFKTLVTLIGIGFLISGYFMARSRSKTIKLWKIFQKASRLRDEVMKL